MIGFPQYSIRVGDYSLTQINSLTMRLSMTELADSFTATISDKVDIIEGSTVGVAIEGSVKLVGEVQSVRLRKAVDSRDLTISGFSAAQRLVKSSIVRPSRTFKDLSLEDLVREVVEPFGIVVDVSESAREAAAEVLTQVRVRPSDNAHTFLKKVCKRKGCILVSGAASITPERTAKASVRITRAGARRAPASVIIRYPSPMVAGIEYEKDVRGVHSDYIVVPKGGKRRSLPERTGLAFDDTVLYSPLVVQAEKGGNSQTSLDTQAEWQLRRRSAEGRRVMVDVHGWSPRPSPTLPSPTWWPNTLYRILDEEEGFDEMMLLGSVELGEGPDGGARARLEFMPPDAYAVLGDREIKTGKVGRRGYAANKAWLAEHSPLVERVDQQSDVVDFDKEKLELYFTPEDPDA